MHISLEKVDLPFPMIFLGLEKKRKFLTKKTKLKHQKTRYYEGKNENQKPEIQGPTVTEDKFLQEKLRISIIFAPLCNYIFFE